MSNITKFPINRTRPSDDMEQSMKFNIRTVITSKEFKQWANNKISDYEFLIIMFEMLPGNKIPPSYEEYMQDHAVIQKEIKAIMESKEFNRPKDTS